jgi:hypothetical protein
MKLPLAAAVCLSFPAALFCQPTMPSWLVNYPGATAQVKSFPALVEATYTTGAAPDAVTDHYRKLFEAQNLAFQPNSDGVGVMVRGSAAECNLLITIHAQGEGAFVRVGCAAKSQSATGGYRAAPQGNSAGGSWPVPPGYKGNVSAAMESHYRKAEEMGLFKVREDADAPPLVWPDWLVHMGGARLSAKAGVDQSGQQFLQSRYVTSEPMTALFAFYKDLLTAHEYPVHTGMMTTGQTQTGIQQNAYGKVEGINYPNGFPGPWTEIRVTLDRMHLNDPITVDLKFTTYAYKAPAPFPGRGAAKF